MTETVQLYVLEVFYCAIKGKVDILIIHLQPLKLIVFCEVAHSSSTKV